MGDRRQVIINEGAEKIHLYTHWAGTELPEIVKAAMKRGEQRWGDAPYLTRIIFCEMIQGEVMQTTGAGIWCSEQHSNHHDIYVDIGKQTVTIDDKKQTFAEFIT